VSRFVYATKGNIPDYLTKGGVTDEKIGDVVEFVNFLGLAR
jgi:hypothetical protein